MELASVYILTDGINSKIGITTDVESRMQSYRTHNPRFKVHRVYGSLSLAGARRIEAIVKTCFKHAPVETSREWFCVAGDQMQRVVEFHLNENPPLLNTAQIAAGRVPVTEIAQEALRLFDGTELARRPVIDEFTKAFGLGIPEYRLPDNSVVRESSIFPDMAHAKRREDNLFDRAVLEHIDMTNPSMLYEEHRYRFYHLVQLSSGQHVALCTGFVSQPYPGRVRDRGAMLTRADDCGLQVFRHDDWSWWSPKRTELYLFIQKTPVTDRLQSWSGSFRKWVIENETALSLHTGLDLVIRDTVHDATFPMDVRSWDELRDRYLRPCGFRSPHLDEQYPRLFDMWNASRVSAPPY